MRLLFLALVLCAAGCPRDVSGETEGVVCGDDSLYGVSDPGCADLVDEDGDGFPIRNTAFACCCDSCGRPDCNDEDPDVRPLDDNGVGPDDTSADGVDQNCDGIDGPPV